MTAAAPFRAALIQLRSGRTVARNLDVVEDLVRQAAAGGAVYVQTPENTTIIEPDRERLRAEAEPAAGGVASARFSTLARDLRLWLHIGAMPVALPTGKLANRGLLIAPDGRIAATYDKIHMFDVDLPGGESYRESRNFAAGHSAVTADLPWGRLGLSICYDLRFPGLYRTLAQLGAEMLAVPSAFTRQTGEAHWHVLLRARAIETGCFVLAAAQGGRHETGRETYGHSIVIDPWGEVLAEAGEEPGVVSTTIDPARVAEVRRRIPSLDHDRPFEVSATVRPLRQVS